MPIDYTRYPPNWGTEIRPAVLHRAKDKCEFCGLKNGSTVYSVGFKILEHGSYKNRRIWFRNKQDAYREATNVNSIKKANVVLTIAHLDHDETNHEVSLDRLAALCQVCHLRYDAREKYRRSMIKK